MTDFHATLVSHTHWDRAWYVTFQEYRIRLVRLVDRLIDMLNSTPDFKVFMLDGQMSVLEDYLEVRPERAAELQAFCQSGRVLVGPWYVLADEFLVSPESLIRNLMIGRGMGEPYGGVMNIGYVPDGFGHIAQLPQILRGFGIDNAFFWRGMGAEGDRLGTEFEWRAPDGSSVTAILMPWGYHNVTNLGYGIHWGDVSQMEFDMELAQEKIERAVNKLKPMANTDALLLMNGIDHAEAEPRIPQIIRTANEFLQGTHVQQGTLYDHLARVRASGKPLESFEGEFRWGRYSEILQGVYSTRIHLKQENHKGETLLEKYVEPLTALAWLSGAEVPAGTPALVWKAWRWLLLNHPHDDIYGSGIDEVHDEMAYRFSQSRQIGDALVRDSLRQIAREVDYSAQYGTPIIVYNPLGWARNEVVEAEIDFEFDDSKILKTELDIAFDDGNLKFELVDGAGNLIPFTVLGSYEVFWMEVLKPNKKHRVKTLFSVSVPPMGYTTVYVQWRSSRPAPQTDLLVHERGAENSYLAFTIEDDGGLTVTDKTTGHTYRDLGHFVDVADMGDEYTFCPLPDDTPITTKGHQARHIDKVSDDNPCYVEFKIVREMNIPLRLSQERRQREGQHSIRPHDFFTSVKLYAGQPSLYIRTLIRNFASDHKLTVNFPTGITAAQAHVDESYMVAARDLKPPNSTGWVEDPTALMHQRTFTDLSDGQRGLAILNRGLPSVEVTEDGTIALTLLRCVGWLSRDDLWVRRIAAGPLVPTPGAQCNGSYAFEYAILPHAGDWREVYQTAHNYNAPLLARRADTHPGLDLREMNITRDDPNRVRAIPWPRGGHLPDTHSFVTVEPRELVLSAVRRTDDGSLLVRLYNITRETVSGELLIGFPASAAYLANLAEETLEALPLEGNRVRLSARGGEVVTVKFEPLTP
jgi:alpha-mannosidase